LSVADTNYTLSFADGTLTITPASSAIQLASSLNPSANGETVTFTATVVAVAPAATTPTGQVRFLQNGEDLGAADLTNGVASLGSTLWNVGTNEVTAEYGGDHNFLSSTNRLLQIVAAPCSSSPFVLSLIQTETNTFALTLLGTTNAQYYLSVSTNLTSFSNWTVLGDSTNAAINGVWSYTFTNAGTPVRSERFFRAQAVNPCP
jgi:hypothetical protein